MQPVGDLVLPCNTFRMLVYIQIREKLINLPLLYRNGRSNENPGKEAEESEGGGEENSKNNQMIGCLCFIFYSVRSQNRTSLQI